MTRHVEAVSVCDVRDSVFERSSCLVGGGRFEQRRAWDIEKQITRRKDISKNRGPCQMMIYKHIATTRKAQKN